MYLNHKLLNFNFLFIATVLLFACTESNQGSNQKFQGIVTESSVKIEPQETIRARLFGDWSAPSLILSRTTDPTTVFLVGSSAAMDNKRNSFLSWHIIESSINPGVDPVYATNVFSKDINGNWADIPSIKSTASYGEPLFSVNQVSGETIAAWRENGLIYSSQFVPDFGWRQAIEHGPGDDFRFSKNKAGNVLLIWNYWSSSEKKSTIAASYFDSQNGWSPTFSLMRNYAIPYGSGISALASRPVQLNNGSFLFSWVEVVEPGVSTLQSARLDPSLGWSSPLTIVEQNVGQNVSQIDRLTLAIEPGSETIKLFYLLKPDAPTYGIYIADYHFNIGFDEFWEPSVRFVDGSKNQNSGQYLDFQVANIDSLTSNLSLLWVADLDDGTNKYSAIQISHFNVTSGWSEPRLISAPLYRYPLSTPATPFDVSIWHFKIASNDNGQVYAAWIEANNSVRHLKVASMEKNRQWGSTEIIATETVLGNYIDTFAITNNENNDARIVWVQESHNTLDTSATLTLFTSEKITAISEKDPLSFDVGQPRPANHISATDLCVACHVSANRVAVDHNEVLGLCFDCHNGLVATGKSVSHTAATEQCDACHGVIQWQPVLFIDHTQVIGQCGDCHNNSTAIGKPTLHIISSDQCIACHDPSTWVPVVVVDHNEVIGACSVCHNNSLAVGQHPFHIATTPVCDACHIVTTWVPFAVDHNEVAGTCESCHVSVPPSHVAVGVTSNCGNCHNTVIWINPTNPLPVPVPVPVPVPAA